MLGRAFKAYDIRGIYPDLLDEKMAWQIGAGVGRFLIEDATAAGETTPMMRNIVVGEDMRKSSPALKERLIAGITASGAHVIDIGLVDTPMIYFAVNYLDCAGGVMTTASHNPPQYNGFKVSKRNAKPVGEVSGLADVRKHAAMAEKNGRAAVPGRMEKRNLWEPYIEHVLSFLDLGGKSIRVVVDASNGMAGTMVPKVFGRNGDNIEGLEIVELNFHNKKGEFVHEPNPLVAANLEQLRARVVEEKADLGICFDGDADRCVIVDETGGIVGCDHLTALLCKHFLDENPGSAVVYDLRSSKAVEEEIKKNGGVPVRSRVGHVFMKQVLAKEGACFGGELSGHFYFADNFNADSGAIAMATILSVVASTNRKVSTMIKPIVRYIQSGEINFENEEQDEALGLLADEYADRAKIDALDGVTIDCFKKEGWWCNVRKSNTEPLLRLNIEAKNEKKLAKILDEISPKLGIRVEH